MSTAYTDENNMKCLEISLRYMKKTQSCIHSLSLFVEKFEGLNEALIICNRRFK